MVQLKVAKSPTTEDFGQGIAKVSQSIMDRYAYEYDEIIEIIANKRMGVRIRPLKDQINNDDEKDSIQLDGLTRTSLGVTLDSIVRIDKTISQTARRVVLAPLNPSIATLDLPSYKFNVLFGTPVTDFDIVAIKTSDLSIDESVSLENVKVPDVSTVTENNRVTEKAGATEVRPNVLGELRFVVTETSPSDIVVITEKTEIILEKILPPKLKSSSESISYDDVGGYHRIIQRLHELVVIPLRNPELFHQLNIDFPKGVLITGSSGIGKTLIARAVANESGAYIVNIQASEIVSGQFGEAEKRLRKYFREAQSNAPTIVIIDDLNTVAPERNPMTTTELSRRLTAEFLQQLDNIPANEPILLVATSNDPGSLDVGFRRPGRFDHEINLGPPDRNERSEILMVKTRGVPLHQGTDLSELGERTKGYSEADLNMLVKEAALASLRRILPKLDDSKKIPSAVMQTLTLSQNDFNEAIKLINPSAMKEIFTDIPDITFEDIGGLDEIKQEIIESVEWPIKRPEIFEAMGVNPPGGVLLFGPPGTGKTLLAKAIANITHSNFIAIRGPELNSKWFGETERAIREVFRKAREISPSIIFFDEIDSMIRIRGSSSAEPWVDRMINQFLTELDGIDKRNQVLVIGATNRPELLDPAVLRPGRFDRLIYVPVPDQVARNEIFNVHTRSMSLDEDVSISELAEKTNYYVGADIENLCREAAILSLREDITRTTVSRKHLLEALKKSQPTMSERTVEYFNNLSQNLRGSVTRRDHKGDRDFFE
ncbi:MAG: AAA family ATPase [Candidatus Kariarchaeaceae archaeon]|jgi:transitional endoplasmic reticulum ATPase